MRRKVYYTMAVGKLNLDYLKAVSIIVGLDNKAYLDSEHYDCKIEDIENSSAIVVVDRFTAKRLFRFKKVSLDRMKEIRGY